MTPCWEWPGNRDDLGYGRVWVGKRRMRTHRRAWELFRGPIPAGMFVCHRCDNPPCCNPDHLFLGTPRDNARDMVAKGRRPRPASQWNEKLSPEQVAEILRRRAAGEKLVPLAAAFNVHNATISRICRRGGR